MTKKDMNLLPLCPLCITGSPFHPVDTSDTKRTQGKQVHVFFCHKWFTEHSWLTFCVSRKKVFCFYCHAAVSKHLLMFSTKADSAFISNGFNNWKKVKDRFRNHEKSHTHMEACAAYAALQQPSIAAQLSHQTSQEQNQRRVLLLKQLSSLKYLVRQELALRGHCEDKGNLHQLLMCRAEDVPALNMWLSDGRYTSHMIFNEQIQLMSHHHMLSDIRSAVWYSVIADETRDVASKEQMAISVRCVDREYNVHEDLIGPTEVTSTDAATLASTIKDTLIRVSLPMSHLCGQAYDGASNMAGRCC